MAYNKKSILRRYSIMTSFLLCMLQYVIIMVLLAAIGGCGAIVGVKLRKNKDAKTSENQEK
jgi:hypothetical protein